MALEAIPIPLLAQFLHQVVFWAPPIPAFVFDCSIAETHKRDSPPTEFEIENGDTISDHVTIKPLGLKIQGLITGSPLFSLGSLAAGAVVTGIGATIPNPGVLGSRAAAIAALPILSNTAGSASAGYDQLLQMQEAKLPITVTTSLHVYANMWIKSISAPRDNKIGGGLIVDIELVQLLLVSPLLVDVSAFAAANLAAAAVNKGKQSAGVLDETAAAAAAGKNNAISGVANLF